MRLGLSRGNVSGRSSLVRPRAWGIGLTLAALGSLMGAPIIAVHGTAAGPSIAYSAYASVSPNSQGNGVAVDHAGNVYVVGTSGDIPKAHVFITKYDPTGSHVLYRKSISAPCGATGNAIAVDTRGNAYITGQY
ncbi:MAG: SBBP repeat-containing protein, partial [Chloroflexota bacterium]